MRAVLGAAILLSATAGCAVVGGPASTAPGLTHHQYVIPAEPDPPLPRSVAAQRALEAEWPPVPYYSMRDRPLRARSGRRWLDDPPAHARPDCRVHPERRRRVRRQGFRKKHCPTVRPRHRERAVFLKVRPSRYQAPPRIILLERRWGRDY